MYELRKSTKIRVVTENHESDTNVYDVTWDNVLDVCNDKTHLADLSVALREDGEYIKKLPYVTITYSLEDRFYELDAGIVVCLTGSDSVFDLKNAQEINGAVSLCFTINGLSVPDGFVQNIQDRLREYGKVICPAGEPFTVEVEFSVKGLKSWNS